LFKSGCTMIVFPNAKINIGLSILGKRKDGYHNILTSLYPVPWQDILELVPAPKETFTLSGLDIPGPATNNLCLKAYHLMKETFNLPPAKMHLHKVIPLAAGLGGGSSDAAFTIKSLNTMFSLDLTVTVMEEIAAGLGSDCPFFIKNIPVIASGTGTELEASDINLKSNYLALVNPDIHIPTAALYQKIREFSSPELNPAVVLNKPLHEWKDLLTNDFERIVFTEFTAIKDIKNQFYKTGAEFAAMSGSGSTVYGIFSEDPDLTVFPDNYRVWKGKID